MFSSPHHYTFFLRGMTPLTARLLRPALIDAQTGKLTDSREMPWYVKTLFLSQPLHFGDYGGLPLKIIWAVLDLITIVVLVTGLYLWLRKPRAVTAGNRRQAAPAIAAKVLPEAGESSGESGSRSGSKSGSKSGNKGRSPGGDR